MADIAFVIDSSGSINEEDKTNWDRVKNFAKRVVGQLDIGEHRVRVGMVEFGNEGVVQFYLNEHYNIPDMTDDIDRSVSCLIEAFLLLLFFFAFLHEGAKAY